METTRQNKISRLIQKELSEIFLLQTKSMNGVLVSSADFLYGKEIHGYPGAIPPDWEEGAVCEGSSRDCFG